MDIQKTIFVAIREFDEQNDIHTRNAHQLSRHIANVIAEQNDPDPEMKDYLDDRDQEEALAHGQG